KPGCFADGLGLYLQVAEGGSKQWLFRFMLKGRARKMGLGPVHTISLEEARDKAHAARKLLLDEIDPIEARQAQRSKTRLEAAKAITFKDAAQQYIRSHEKGWTNHKHRTQWSSSLATYAYPTLGDLAVATIDTALVLRTIEPIWYEKAETASRVRS